MYWFILQSSPHLARLLSLPSPDSSILPLGIWPKTACTTSPPHVHLSSLRGEGHVATAEVKPHSQPCSSPPNGLWTPRHHRAEGRGAITGGAGKANDYMMLRSTMVENNAKMLRNGFKLTHLQICSVTLDGAPFDNSSHLALQDQVCVELLFIPEKTYHSLAFVPSCLFELKLCSIVVHGISGEEWICQCN